MNQDTANSFVKKVGVTKSASSDDIYVREDFYNAYREECCNKGCRLEEALEFCNTLTWGSAHLHENYVWMFTELNELFFLAN
jgi:hypothetical protein